MGIWGGEFGDGEREDRGLGRRSVGGILMRFWKFNERMRKDEKFN